SLECRWLLSTLSPPFPACLAAARRGSKTTDTPRRCGGCASPPRTAHHWQSLRPVVVELDPDLRGEQQLCPLAFPTAIGRYIQPSVDFEIQRPRRVQRSTP